MKGISDFIKDTPTPNRNLAKSVRPGVFLIHEYLGKGKVIAIDDDVLSMEFNGRIKHFAWPQILGLLKPDNGGNRFITFCN